MFISILSSYTDFVITYPSITQITKPRTSSNSTLNGLSQNVLSWLLGPLRTREIDD